MKALRCHEFLPYAQHTVEECDPPLVGPGQLLIDVHAAGVNFPDILMVEGKYQMKPLFPFIAGAECAGLVREVGDGVDDFTIGDRVLCVTQTGAFAQLVAAPAPACFKIPDAMGFDEAAALTIVYGTALHALKQRAQIKSGETMLVLGAAGGVGLAAIALGKAMGAMVIAAASTDEKGVQTKKHGADHAINYSDPEWRKQVKALAPNGVDVVFDPVGDKFAEPAMRSLGWGGRYLVIGFAGGDIPKIPLNLTLLKSADIKGVFWGAWTMRDFNAHQENMRELMNFYTEGKIKPPISNHYRLEDFVDAFDELAERRAIGKVVLTMK